MPKNLEQKGLTNVVKVCVKIMPDCMLNGQMDVKRGIKMLKQCGKMCWKMYTGFSRFGGRLIPVLWSELLEGLDRVRSWRGESEQLGKGAEVRCGASSFQAGRMKARG
jgi:hypothetical protein